MSAAKKNDPQVSRHGSSLPQGGPSSAIADPFSARGDSRRTTPPGAREAGDRDDEPETVEQQETKAERFTRLCINRTNNVLEDIDSLAKLADRNNYDYSTEQVQKVFDALQERMVMLAEAFRTGKRGGGFTF